ncbi:Piwi domain-containing protein [Gillisia sp. Hel_I_86]|uniref:argonaute/piwi family protein n=1 Tax=Gillisia sp. Hel_I_86 TaxID=1249981 RepID=UPI00119A8D34|nr:hypothetical protein [Gillisia sp. Hel_I_86]TVZ26708.1 Piwi domain-containing protein [Gillisia sp. Hel_I_86]
MNKLKNIIEPKLLFNHNQEVQDPRDGLTLFGPYSKDKVNNFSIGIIGTPSGIDFFKSWLTKFLNPVIPLKKDVSKPFYPGFEAIFGITVNLNSTVELEVSPSDLKKMYRYSDSHVRVSSMVDLFVDKIIDQKKEDDRPPVNLWFVIIPDEVYQHGRVKSKPAKDPIKIGIKDKYSRTTVGLFDEIDPTIKKLKDSYNYENNFHNQLKLKLLKHEILTQIIRESTIAYDQHPYLNSRNEPKRDLANMESDICWNIATSVYYKLGGLPWKLGKIRKDVCYIGLVFKINERNKNNKYACCAAQMFLDSGDGMVFKGAVGPWYNEDTKEFHLSEEASKDLLNKALDSFKRENNRLPKEIFIHGKTYFSNEEWKGFLNAVEGQDISIIGVTIKEEKVFKLYRNKDFPILRGSYYTKSHSQAYLWTKGFIPRLQQPLGMETPNPLSIKVTRGARNTNINTVCKDILALTKLNYNSCKFCDGSPVTLKFANVIGEILTSGEIEDLRPALPFRYYI